MNTVILILILVIIVLVGLVIVGYIINYNKIQFLNIKINESEHIIDENLRKKYDLIIRSQTIIDKLLKKEVSYFKELKKLKDEDISNFDLDRKISEGENLVNQVKNDYKSLNDNEEFQEILDNLKEADEVLDASKAFYNKYTTETNMLLKKFPTNIIGLIHRIKTRNYFDGKNMFDDEINDFKL